MSRMWTVLLSVLGLVIGAPALAQPSLPGGWSLAPDYKARACWITGPRAGDATLAFKAKGGTLTMEVQAPEYPRAPTTLPVDLRVDGGPVLHFTALADIHMAHIDLEGAAADTVARASRITVTAKGRTRTFQVHDVATAIDIMERCRGDATLAERRAMTAKPIAGAGGWTLFDRTPDGPPCVARLAGGQIDTELMPDERPGVFVLGARRPGWASWGHAIRIGLSIDGAKPSRMTAWSLLNGVLLRMAGPARPERLRGASTLDWTLPTGRFHADVTGIGAAFDAVKACRQRHARRRAR